MDQQELQQLLERLVQSLYSIKVEVKVEAAEPNFGDYSSNIAFTLAGRLHRQPIEIAAALADKISDERIAGASAAGGGYVNVTFHNNYWLQQLKAIKPTFGQSQLGKGKKVQVEFISANPTGPLTMGNGRGGYWGDILSNVLAWNGYEVHREYYINDAGNQIELLKNSIFHQIAPKKGSPDAVSEEFYKGEYIEELAEPIIAEISKEHPEFTKYALAKQQQIANQKIDEHAVLDQMISHIKAAVAKMGIEFDVWFSETSLHKSGLVAATVEKLISSGGAKQFDGAIWLKLSQGKDRVLQKQDGSYTYLAVDLAYHYDKFINRHFDKVINLWGADHGGQVNSLVTGVEALGIKGELDIILFQLVRLIKNGKEFKVSKRAGTYVTIDELLDEIDPSVARYFFAMRTNDTHMDFDLDLAKEQSQKNPYYYVMYAYVRAQSILSKSKAKDLKPQAMGDLVGVEKTLVKQMAAFPDLLQEIAADFGVHRLTFYGQSLAKLFHEYYETTPILSADAGVASQRLSLIQHFVWLMEAYFEVMGLEPQTKM